MSSNRRPIDIELQLEIDRLQEVNPSGNPTIIRNVAKRNIQYVERVQEIARRERVLQNQGWSVRPFEAILGGVQ